MNTIQEVSKDTLTIESFLKEQSEGQELTYAIIEKRTGVLMDERGKTYLKSALRRLKLPYEVFRGQGIRLLCADNAMRIVAHKTIRIDSATRRAEKVTNQVVKSDTFEKIDIANQQRLNGLASLYATIRVFAGSAKRIFNSQKIRIGDEVK